MRILIDNSGYHLQNMGDVAMLQVAVDRIREFVPGAELVTLTIAPDDLQKFVQGNALHENERRRWLTSRAIPVPVRRSWLSESLRNRLDATESRFKVHFPRLSARSIRLMGGRDPESKSQSSRFVDEVRQSDLLVVTGGGFLTDAFVAHANDVLTTLELAQRLGKPTLVFGQGVGPLTCDRTKRRMGEILNRVARVGIREKKFGQQALTDVGVHPSKVVCTGDDAIELAYSHRASTLGDAIGVNLRVANYSGVSSSQVATLRDGLAAFCAGHGLRSIPIPISYFGQERDLDRVNDLMEGSAGYSQINVEPSPAAVAQAVSRCRVVVTGSYHAGVFALSQGIPVVGLAASQYYHQKFLGLQGQFGVACQFVDLSTDFASSLQNALRTSFKNASEWRGPLLRNAQRQIAASRSLYQTGLSECLSCSRQHTKASYNKTSFTKA